MKSKTIIGQPTLNGKPITITDSWDKMTFKQYLRVLKAPKDDLIELISIITGVEYETLKNAKIGGLPKLMFVAKFMNEPAKFPDKPKKIGKFTLPLNSNGIFDIQLESLAQFEDMRHVMNKTEPTIYAHTEAYATYCALYLQKIRDGEYDADKAFKMVPELMEYPAGDIISAGGFFFRQATELIEWHGKQLPEYSPTPEEAHWEAFSKKFGTYATIDKACRTLGITEDEIYLWSARRFWFKHIYLAWESFNMAEDHKQLMKK